MFMGMETTKVLISSITTFTMHKLTFLMSVRDMMLALHTNKCITPDKVAFFKTRLPIYSDTRFVIESNLFLTANTFQIDKFLTLPTYLCNISSVTIVTFTETKIAFNHTLFTFNALKSGYFCMI